MHCNANNTVQPIILFIINGLFINAVSLLVYCVFSPTGLSLVKNMFHCHNPHKVEEQQATEMQTFLQHHISQHCYLATKCT
jgi:hypothetical protein